MALRLFFIAQPAVTSTKPFDIAGLDELIDLSLRKWPPRSQTSPRAASFSGVLREDTVYSPPLPYDLQKLRQLIITCVTVIDEDLEKAWRELDYQLDVCHVTQGARIVNNFKD
jgi:hypothetical protein